MLKSTPVHTFSNWYRFTKDHMLVMVIQPIINPYGYGVIYPLFQFQKEAVVYFSK